MAIVTTQVAGKMGEIYVFSELLKRDAIPYVPLVDEGVNALVRTSSGRFVEVQIKTAGAAGGQSLWFQLSRIKPRKTFFIVCVEFTDGEPDDVWVFPSCIVDEYTSRRSKGSRRDLILDYGARKYGMALEDLLCGFRNRWELITDYDRYEHLMESTEDLEDIFAMKEAAEAPEEEAFTLGEYERRRAAAMLSSSPLVGED